MDTSDTTFAVSMLGALFAVMNPFVNLPFFLALTDGQTSGQRRATALRVGIASAIACALVAVAGSALLDFFGISIDAFRVAGGLVLATIGFHMLNGAETPSHHGSASERAAGPPPPGASIAVYPMTFPMVVGPGTIATLVLYAHAAGTAARWAGYVAVVAAVLAALLVVLLAADSIGKRMSATLRTVMTRVMGMILVAIAVGMVAAGTVALLPGLGAPR